MQTDIVGLSYLTGDVPLGSADGIYMATTLFCRLQILKTHSFDFGDCCIGSLVIAEKTLEGRNS